MNPKPELLWPYGARGALIAALVILLLAAALVSVMRAAINWPGDETLQSVALVAILLSLLPTAFLLLDFAATRRAVLDIRGVRIDFSNVDLSRTEVRRESPSIPDNIGVSGPIISDTTPMSIIRALEEATHSEIVVIDLKAGEAWWVTRLLALSAGAVRAGAPEVFVFVGRRENRDHHFLGWAESKAILQAILRDKPDYQERYDRAMRIARQVLMYGSNEFLPTSGNLVMPHPDVARYTNEPQYAALGDAVVEQILMDQLAGSMPGPPLEQPPDRLTLARLNELFGHCLLTRAVDLTSPGEQQVAEILRTKDSHIALVRGGRYDAMMRREDAQQLLLQQLVHGQAPPGTS